MRVRRALASAPRTLVVLDNHESDVVTASLLEELGGLPVSFVITARRCLLAGVTVYPVVAPLISAGGSAFVAVAPLTKLLRWHPVALDIADALVTNGVMTVSELERRLAARGVGRIVPVEHEDDVREVRGVVEEAHRHLSAGGKRALSVLMISRGDTMDGDSLVALARLKKPSQTLADLARSRLVQTPGEGRFALHATVRYALSSLQKGREASLDVERYAAHYLELFERSPERIIEEQTHLFALMDWAQDRGMATILRVHALIGATE